MNPWASSMSLGLTRAGNKFSSRSIPRTRPGLVANRVTEANAARKTTPIAAEISRAVVR